MMRAAGALCCAMVLAAVPQQPTRFRTSAEAVSVDVLVLDGNRPVGGLAAGDFEVRDKGVVQTVSAVAMTDVPVSVMLALDVSNSVRGRTLARLKEAALAALEPLGPADRAALLTFNHAVLLRADWSAPSGAFTAAVQSMEAGGFTSLHDGIFSALQLHDPAPGRRSLVLVFTDGGDTASWLPARAVMEKARRTDAVTYAVFASSGVMPVDYGSGVQLWARDNPPPFETAVLSDVATLTGGEQLVARAAGSLRDTFRKIVTDFRSRYVLTYIPQGVDAAGWHPIEVKLKGGRRGKITARRGYLR
jgi:VWFA-related protein